MLYWDLDVDPISSTPSDAVIGVEGSMSSIAQEESLATSLNR